jgi:hypothetical protein
MSLERDAIVTSARELVATDGLLVDLDQLDEPRQFLEYAGTLGASPVYRLAFLLTSHLIEAHGLEALVEYFRICPARRDWRASFEEVFGRPLLEFEQDVAGAASARHAQSPTIPLI